MRNQRRLVATVSAVVVAPVLVEFLIAYIKSENYDVLRAGEVVLGSVVACALLVAVMNVNRQARLTLAVAVVTIGAVIAATAVLALLATVPETTAALIVAIVCLGSLVSILAGLIIYVDRKGLDLRFTNLPAETGQPVEVGSGAGNRRLITRFAGHQTSDEEVLALCSDEVDPGAVHFIGYYVDGVCRFHVDTLDNTNLNNLFRGVDRQARRHEYERAGRKMHWLVRRLGVYTSQLNGGILIRTILDIEQGGLFYYWIDTNVHLIGVTLDQDKVLTADVRLRRLANRIGRQLPRRSHPIIEQEEEPAA